MSIMEIVEPTFLASTTNSSTRLRSKLLALSSSGSSSDQTDPPAAEGVADPAVPSLALGPGPQSLMVTLASVPAPRTSHVCTVILYLARAPLLASELSITVRPFSLLSHSPWKKYAFSLVLVLTTSMWPRCQSLPKLFPSSVICALVILPMSMSLRKKVSVLLRSKLLALFSSVLAAVITSLPSFSPYNLMETLPSVPANRMSDVFTSIR
mmetsp:Transcript_24383/g.79604  ORF Transcript_24383/g.79604 Transcript_24383/m.79604 type:complete len:210 (+) Transcript_24383:749-1378(+)